MGRPRSWTDDQLRTAVADSESYSEVVRRLRALTGAGDDAVRSRIEELALDTSHFNQRSRRTRLWKDDDLRDAVASARSLNGVFTALGLIVGGTQWIVVRERIRELGLATDHWERPLGSGGRRARWTDDDLRRVVPDSRSFAEVLRRLGLKQGGGTQATITARIEELGLDTSHMVGQAWLRGRKDPRPRRYKKPLDQILVEDSTYLNNRVLKDRLVREGLKEECCERCGIKEWNGRPLSLHLDHVNGDRRDNRLENLRLLCPNCHSQTDTYCGRNVGRYSSEAAGCYEAA